MQQAAEISSTHSAKGGVGSHGSGRRLPPLSLGWTALIVLGLLAAGAGAMPIGVADLLAVLAAQVGLGAADPTYEAVLFSIRLPRVGLGMIHGALLAVSGALLQGLFRNPLADPGLLGTSGGAMAAAATWTVLVAPHMPAAAWWALPAAAFVGALGATLAVLRIGGTAGRADPAILLLAGIAINALAMAVTGLLLSIGDDAQIRSLTFWSLGSLGGSNVPTLLLLLAPLGVLALAARSLGPRLDVLLLGAREAAHLGVQVPRLQLHLVLCTALAVGGSVAMAGTIGFVGLVVPNLVRMVVGPSHRHLLPWSAAVGAGLVVAADALARVVIRPAELPIGVITTLLGVPFFLYLLRRRLP